MTKNAAVKFGYHCHNLAQKFHDREVLESVAVIGKFDCRIFCHINSLEDKISNTAATIQPNPFWFWEKYCNIKMIFRSFYLYIDSLFPELACLFNLVPNDMT